MRIRPQDVITARDDIESIELRRGVARDVNSSCETCAAWCAGNFVSETDAVAVGKRTAWRVEKTRRTMARRKRWDDRIERRDEKEVDRVSLERATSRRAAGEAIEGDVEGDVERTATWAWR